MGLKGLSGAEVVKALSKAGFVPRRMKGSHIVLVRHDVSGKTVCVVPLHKDLKIGTLKAILRQAKLSEAEFLDLL